MLEHSLFGYDEYDGDRNRYMIFMGCTLRQDIGEYKPGDYIPMIMINYKISMMYFYSEDNNVIEEFKLNLSASLV